MTTTYEAGLTDEQLAVVYKTAREARRLDLEKRYLTGLGGMTLPSIENPDRGRSWLQSVFRRRVKALTPLLFRTHEIGSDELLLQVESIYPATGQPVDGSRLTIGYFARRDETLQLTSRSCSPEALLSAIDQLEAQARVGIGDTPGPELLAFQERAKENPQILTYATAA